MSFVCLAYHRITANPEALSDPYTVTPEDLRAQLAWLARRGYRGVPLETAWAQDQVQPLVAITFDDGYRDFQTAAWPLLQEFGYGATVFVVTGRIGQPADWPEARGAPLLSWAELRTLAREGVAIGLHGARHHPLDTLPTAPLPATLRAARQMATAAIGVEPVGFAYPYGRYSPDVMAGVRAAGFSWAATARGGVNRPTTHRFALRRTLITGRDGSGWRFGLKIRTGYARLVEWRMDWRQIE
jgi:peptidoglycan/xylan/chitin deacetylase (PgdA/CDA1 family)